jgi:hypothetical protein
LGYWQKSNAHLKLRQLNKDKDVAPRVCMPLASTYPLPSRFSDSNQKVGHQRRDHLPPTYAGSPTFNKSASADIMTRIATIISVLGILPPTARLQVTGLHVKSDKSCQLYCLQPVFCIAMRLDRGRMALPFAMGRGMGIGNDV